MLRSPLRHFSALAALMLITSTHVRAQSFGDGPFHEDQIKVFNMALSNGDSIENAQKRYVEEGQKLLKQIKIEGQPVRYIFKNGNEIGFKIKSELITLRSSMILSDNSCTRAIGNKGEFVIPAVQRALIPYWIKHPVFQGQPVIEFDNEDKINRPKVASAFLTFLNHPGFLNDLAAVPPKWRGDKTIFDQTSKLRGQFGWMKCEGKCDDLLPTNKTALFWDENFEVGNDQSNMSKEQDEKSLNQMTSRLQQVPLKVEGGRIVFGVPKKIQGSFATIFPPGISYQLQWTFRAKNLTEPDDEFCLMKWDLDFTRIFTEFTKIGEGIRTAEKLNHQQFPEYIYRAVDEENLLLTSALSESAFDDKDVAQ